ncbi:MAG: hypothetical protein KKA42_06785, partial [candidate division Zixibacteria bacterium]|nr:hypothetical protein [candidate division Zixibacteria bacterium]
MTTKTKIVALVVGTFLLGIVVGVVGSGIMMARFMDSFGKKPFTDRLIHVMERQIDPTETQRDTVRAILETHAALVQESMAQHRGALIAMTDSLYADLSRVLTEEQLEAFKEGSQRIKRMFPRPPGMGDGPGGPGFFDHNRPGGPPPGERWDGHRRGDPRLRDSLPEP